MKNNLCQLWLTCANKEEADTITRSLLVKSLVACVKQFPVASKYHWQGEAHYKSAKPSVALAKEGKIESSQEVLLLMEGRLDLFDEVEREVARLHSYKTFVLTATPISKVSEKAKLWLKSELKNGK